MIPFERFLTGYKHPLHLDSYHPFAHFGPSTRPRVQSGYCVDEGRGTSESIEDSWNSRNCQLRIYCWQWKGYTWCFCVTFCCSPRHTRKFYGHGLIEKVSIYAPFLSRQWLVHLLCAVRNEVTTKRERKYNLFSHFTYFH